MSMFSKVRTLARATPRVVAGGLLLSFGTATYYRPLPSPPLSDEDEGVSISIGEGSSSPSSSSSSMELATSYSTAAPLRKNERFCSEDLPYFNRENTPLLLSLARYISIGATTLAIRLFMNTYGQYDIQDDEHYQHFLNLVLARNDLYKNTKDSGVESESDDKVRVKDKDKDKVPLITISNHRSLFDDPGVVSCLLPLWMGIQPKYNRWGICSQEYCFNDVLPAVVKGYIGAGQVLPIQRGAGINQGLFSDFASLVAMGEWCHIFPEGGVWQWKELGGRGRQNLTEVQAKDPKNVTHVSSKLKYGIGKLIAHAPVTPRVVPFAHVGMENLFPQDKVTRKTYLKKQFFGGDPLRVHIRFGGEIHFDDLIEEYETTHGSLWKYNHGHNHHQHQNFISSESEKVLYAKITARIEEHLEKLATRTVSVATQDEDLN